MSQNFKIKKETVVLPKIIEIEGLIIKNYSGNLPVQILPNYKGIIYNGNGFLLYRGPGGTLTTISSS
jgi:hypothetical protein